MECGRKQSLSPGNTDEWHMRSGNGHGILPGRCWFLDADGKWYAGTLSCDVSSAEGSPVRMVLPPVSYTHLDCYIMFGKESAGIPEEILLDNQENCVRIPMWGDIRSLNLSNSVSIVLYEALRQNGFEKMQMQGELHHLKWK